MPRVSTIPLAANISSWGMLLASSYTRSGNKWPVINVLDAIYQKAKEMVDLKFPSFGSLYLADSPVSPNNKQTLDEKFCVGPHCGTRYWDFGIGEDGCYLDANSNRGPCESLREHQ